MTYDGLNTIVYDAENHTTSATNSSASGAYVFDGKRMTVPLRSSIYRGILAGGETASATFLAADFAIRAGEGAFAEGKALLNGTCH